MTRAAIVFISLICLVWALVYAGLQSPAHARQLSNSAFQKEWSDTKVDLNTLGDPSKAAKARAAKTASRDEKATKAAEDKPRKQTRKRKGSSSSPDLVKGDGPRESQRAVCRSQCSLERMSCDQGRNAFQNRSDQIQAAQSSCFLAVQSCLNRC